MQFKSDCSNNKSDFFFCLYLACDFKLDSLSPSSLFKSSFFFFTTHELLQLLPSLLWNPLCMSLCACPSFVLFFQPSHISLSSPLFLTPVFPFLLPGKLLTPVTIWYQTVSLTGWYKMICFHSVHCQSSNKTIFICKFIWRMLMWNREWGQRSHAHMYWVMYGHCAGTVECYKGGKKLDMGLFLLMGGDLQVTHFFSWAIT